MSAVSPTILKKKIYVYKVEYIYCCKYTSTDVSAHSLTAVPQSLSILVLSTLYTILQVTQLGLIRPELDPTWRASYHDAVTVALFSYSRLEVLSATLVTLWITLPFNAPILILYYTILHEMHVKEYLWPYVVSSTRASCLIEMFRADSRTWKKNSSIPVFFCSQREGKIQTTPLVCKDLSTDVCRTSCEGCQERGISLALLKIHPQFILRRAGFLGMFLGLVVIFKVLTVESFHLT